MKGNPLRLSRPGTIAGAVALIAAAGVVFPGVWPVPASAGPQQVAVHTLPDQSEVDEASAWLHRDDTGVLMALRTTGLEAGAAYTVWWVVFNNPEACVAAPDETVRCGADDVERPETEPSILHAAGAVPAGRGDAYFGARLPVRDTSGCQAEPHPCGKGLTKPMDAEIHLVVRSHGPADPDQVDAQLSTLHAGCEERGEEMDLERCPLVQGAAFPPA